MQFGQYTVEISNRDKRLFPEQEITKNDVIEYYDRISDRLLPYLKDRPLTLLRYPDGIEEDGFYQKKVPDYFPDWIKTIKVKKKEGGSVRQVICNNKATLIYLVNQGTVSFHPWLSRISSLNYPDKLVFDLDPPEGSFDLVCKGATVLRTLLEEVLGLNAFLMTTGSKGMHVVCPVKPNHTFEEVRSFAEQVAAHIEEQHPDAFTTEMRIEKRKGKLFLDYLRNSYAQTAIAPYTLRPIKGAPIATPLSWDEVNKKGLTSQTYHIKNIFRRLARKDEPWKQFNRKAKGLEGRIDKLHALAQP